MDDLISRQALMKEFSDFVRASNSSDFAQTPTWNDAVSLVGSMPSAHPDLDEWCTDCSEYDQERHCCPRWNRVIRQTLKDAQPERKTGEWIPCSERLPEENGEYLVTRESSSYRYIDIVKKSNCNSHLPMASDIKAWMPLPEPWEGKQNEIH